MDALSLFRLVLIVGGMLASMDAALAGGDASCSTRDFRKSLGPVRDQKHSGFCWAYSASDLISQKVGRLVSASDLATTFLVSPAERLRTSASPQVQSYLRQNPRFFTSLKAARDHEESWIGKGKARRAMRMIADEDHGFTSLGGDESAAILLANLKGYCAESRFPSDPDAVITMMKTAKHNVKLKKNLSQECLKETGNDSTIGSLNAIGGAIVKAYEADVDKRCKHSAFRPAVIPETLSYLNEIESDHYSRRHKKKLREKLFSKADDVVERGLAVSVTLDMKSLEHDSEWGDDYHVATIAGRKMIGGQCHYLLRNSYGNDACKMYKKRFRAKCEKGDLWLSQEDLRPAMNSITYIK